MRSRGKKVYIATNAHDKVLDLKLRKTEIGKYLTALSRPPRWDSRRRSSSSGSGRRKSLDSSRERTLFVDDTVAVLRTAKQYGIRYIVYKAKGNSKMPPGHSQDFATVMDFNELM